MLRLSIPAAPAQTATMKANASGSEMMLASRCDSTSKSSGIRSAPSKASVASVVAAIASGKPTTQRDRRASRQIRAALHDRDAEPGDAGRTPARRPSRRRRGSRSRGRSRSPRSARPGPCRARTRPTARRSRWCAGRAPPRSRRPRAEPGAWLVAAIGEVRDRVGRADRDRAVAGASPRSFRSEMITLASSRATSHITRSPSGLTEAFGDPDHVDRRRRLAQHRVDPIGPIGRRHDAQMDHRRSLFGGRCKIGCSPVGAHSALRRGIRESRRSGSRSLRTFPSDRNRSLANTCSLR